MKKHKRNKKERAYSKGYQNGIYGKSNENCPHYQPETRFAWLNGWRDGWADRSEGYRPIPGLPGPNIVSVPLPKLTVPLYPK